MGKMGDFQEAIDNLRGVFANILAQNFANRSGPESLKTVIRDIFVFSRQGQNILGYLAAERVETMTPLQNSVGQLNENIAQLNDNIGQLNAVIKQLEGDDARLKAERIILRDEVFMLKANIVRLEAVKVERDEVMGINQNFASTMQQLGLQVEDKVSKIANLKDDLVGEVEFRKARNIYRQGDAIFQSNDIKNIDIRQASIMKTENDNKCLTTRQRVRFLKFHLFIYLNTRYL